MAIKSALAFIIGICMGIYCVVVTFTFRDEDGVCSRCTEVINDVLMKLQQHGARIIDVKPSSANKVNEVNYLTSYVMILYESRKPIPISIACN